MKWTKKQITFSLIGLGIAAATGTAIAAFTTDDITVATPTYNAYDYGTDNAYIGAITLPDPETDTIVVNGATTTIAAGDTLTAFTSSYRYHDADNDDEYDVGEGVVTNDSDSVLNSSDIVVTNVEGVLTAFPSSPTETSTDNAIGWVDSNDPGTVGEYDNGENLGTIFRNPSGATDGTTVRVFPSDIAYLADENYASYNIANGNAIIEDTDGDGYLSGGDTVLANGKAALTAFSTSQNVCYDQTGGANADYEPTDVIWWDAGGDCSAFSTGVDVILVGNAAPTGTSYEFGSTEFEVGFLDSNDDDTYDCSRTACEAVTYKGSDGAVIATDDEVTSSFVFFDSSTEGTDGIATIGSGWDESGNILETIVFFDEKTEGSTEAYFYIDADSNADFTITDPMLETIAPSNRIVSNGLTWRTFYDNDYHYYDRLGDGEFLVNDVGHDALVASADDVLDAGGLDGSGTDEVILPERVGGGGEGAWDGSLDSEDLKYHDHDTSGSYADGDDIVFDIDDNNLYNADDIVSLVLENGSSDDAISDIHIDGVYIYEQVGASCVGAGTDTLVGSDTSDPILEQTITITKDPYTAASSESEKTLCFYIDILDDTSAIAKKLSALVSSITFASGAATGDDISFSESGGGFSAETVSTKIVNATITPASTIASATTTYTASMTTSTVEIPSGAVIVIQFPEGYDISGATFSCTDDGVSTGGTSIVFGQLGGLMGTTSAIAAGSTLTCTGTSIVNPDTDGETNEFIFTASTGNLTPYNIDIDETVTIGEVEEEESSSSGGRRSRLSRIENNTEQADEEIEETTDTEQENQEEDLSEDKVQQPKPACATSLPAEINVGDYVLGELLDGTTYPAVFFIGQDCQRHIFTTVAIYKTYQDDFSVIKNVPIDVLGRVTEGVAMPVNPETILIKSTESPDVYFVTQGEGELERKLYKIRSEEEARNFFGAEWTKKIIDIHPYFIRSANISEGGIETILNEVKELKNRENLRG